jgi:hypothetical protein
VDNHLENLLDNQVVNLLDNLVQYQQQYLQ